MSRILARHSDWAAYEGRPLIVTSFTPESGAGARATVALEYEELPPDTVGVIFQRLDFEHLQAAFAERGDGDDKVVMIEWSTRHLTGIKRLFAPFLPRLTVGVFTTCAYELLINPDCQPELKGEARFLAEKPIAMWEPIA